MLLWFFPSKDPILVMRNLLSKGVQTHHQDGKHRKVDKQVLLEGLEQHRCLIKHLHSGQLTFTLELFNPFIKIQFSFLKLNHFCSRTTFQRSRFLKILIAYPKSLKSRMTKLNFRMPISGFQAAQGFLEDRRRSSKPYHWRNSNPFTSDLRYYSPFPSH